MRTICAPGVEIKEIDKSGYAPAMTGTKCFVVGFANKGEPYLPMEFTSRSAWINYYGEPDNEAERYFFNACMEVINQNGVLYCARLPYDNTAKDKMVGHKFNVSAMMGCDWLTSENGYFREINVADPTISDAYVIDSSELPSMYDLDKVELWRADEEKVPSGKFIIIDKTCAPYKKIIEDERKGQQRELLGIVPVVTTAANGLYAQKLIEVKNYRAKYYESIGKIDTLNGETNGISGGDATETYSTSANIFNTDLTKQLNSVYKNYSVKYDNFKLSLETIGDINLKLNECIISQLDLLNAYSTLSDLSAEGISSWPVNVRYIINGVSSQMINDAIELNNPAVSAEAPGLTSLYISKSSKISDCQTAVQKLYNYVDGYGGIHAVDGDDSLPETISFEANTFFPTIDIDKSGEGFDSLNLKKIGVVVYKTYIDPSEGNKITFEPVEAFVGSLCKDDVDPNTGVTTFMDTIVNTTSEYINFFSNCFNTSASKKEYKEKVDILLVRPTDNTGSLGYYEKDVEEYISLDKSIYDGMNKAFDKVSDINERDIDIVPDAGIANIGSFIKAVYNGKGKYELDTIINEATGATACSMWKCDNNNDAIKTWKTIEQKYDNFCKNVRKDCMFIADGPRPLVLQGQKKIVRPTKPSNTIDANILPYVKYATGLNTNYGAGYLDWFQKADEFTGDFFWCPPSIQAMGVYIYTDANFNYWDAPAGLNRGMVAAVDVAFSPTPKQAGTIYEKNWNYAINYPQDGIILEGQKTFQVKPSAFDRVNVRRLFLRLERQTYKVARYFVYEGNTAYTRQRLIDTLNPIFYQAKVGGGLYDYKIICDESINTPNVIDNNELKVKIGLKPTKTAEFILIDFIALSTGGSFSEM